MKCEIKYYMSEGAKRSGCAAFTETINGDKRYCENLAENRLRSNPNFKLYEIIEK